MIYSTTDIPQADRLEKVIQTVEAVNSGLSKDVEIATEIGFTDRQARYYRHAAALLGFIENDHNTATITSSGKQLAQANADEKLVLIKQAVWQNNFFKDIIRFFESSQRDISTEELSTFILSKIDNEAKSTVGRRIKTILSWLEELEIIVESDNLYQFNETSGVEYEDNPESIYPTTTYSQEIDIFEQKFSVYELLRKIDDGKITLNPDFQRNLVWKQHQKSQFIESLILNIPLPPFYFKQELNGSYIIVDGLQRTSALSEFLPRLSTSKVFPLIGLEALPQLNGKYFQDLDQEIKTRIEDKGLFIYILRPSVPMPVVYDIFNRINTGGTKLERQEIRNCIFIGKSTELLKELAESSGFKKATDGGISSTRMKDREAILRCLAFMIFDYKKDYTNSIDDLLERAMKRLNKMSDYEIASLKMQFHNAMEITFDFFGRNNFRIPVDSWRGRINIAVMETICFFFATNKADFLLKYKQNIIDNFYNKLLIKEEYLAAVKFSTGTPSKVTDRFRYAEQLLSEV
jgi:hypothetical protein